jgi:cysteine desulfurase / selenocysteine lyase
MSNPIINTIRDRFPALSQQVYGKNLVYLDNAATSQKPDTVIALLNEMNSRTNANVHRAMYKLSDDTTALYESARERVREFINAPTRENIIFTSGTTASINLVASSFGRRFLNKGDVVVITGDSHHSNIVPWQLACKYAGASVRVLPINDKGEWELDKFDDIVDSRVKIVAATQISNVLGVINPIESLIGMAHAHNIPVLVDGAQGIVHTGVDVIAMGCDFYAFSAHKVYGETGSGILYGKRDLLEEMPPYMGGGDMVDTVTFEETSYAPLPLKFEAGTPNFIANAALKPALDFAKEIREGEIGRAVATNEKEIIDYMRRELPKIEGIEIYGNAEKKIPLFSLNIKGVNAGDIAQILDKLGIAVRTGMMCAEPVMARFGVTSMVRASFAPYNTLEEAQYFVEGVKRVGRMLL